MNVLHLSTSDLDGGAARGAYQIHKALQRIGVNSQMLVAHKVSADPTVIGPKDRGIDKILSGVRPALERFYINKYKQKKTYVFSPAIFPNNIAPQVREINPDIINIHWICRGFLTPESLGNLNKPLVWTLRDMWGFTGGCHYAGDCQGYTERCGACPLLGSDNNHDISRKLWQRKQKSWQNLNLTLVPVSHWVADCAKQSRLFKDCRQQVIHSTFDTSTFKPRSKTVAREMLELPDKAKIILFGAIDATSDSRKGFHYLRSALKRLAESEMAESIQLVIFGASSPRNPPDLGIKTTYLGKLFDDLTLSLVYTAADVTVVPSTQDACPKTAMESLACGTPVVCFDSTGLKDIVDHQETGYRATCFQAEDLTQGIRWVLADEDRWYALSKQARIKVEREFDSERQARAYLNLYQEVLERSNLSA